MKKLSFILGFSFLAIMTFGQNTANVSQTGDNGQANITQGGGDLNNVKITQVETATTLPVGNQVATAKQTGTSNVATINQTETGDGSHTTNNAYIEQIGLTNTSNQNTYAPGYNSGQSVWGYQNGEYNTLNQTWQAGYTNSFNASMTGKRNHVIQGWKANNSHGYVTIVGDDNHASQGLYNDNEGYGIGIKIDQTGSNNDGIQEYRGGAQGHNNVGIIKQNLDNNIATQTVNGFDVYANIDQDGYSNSAYQLITGNNNFSNLKYIEVKQKGNQNISDQQVLGNSNQASLIQTGDENESRIKEIGDLNIFKGEQLGNINLIAGLDADCAPTLYGVLQNGIKVDVSQKGNLNKLYFNTAGNLKVIQNNTGTDMVGNLIKYTQTAAGAVELNQIGDKNTMLVKNTSSELVMDVDLDQIGNGNNIGRDYVDGLPTKCALFAGKHLNVDQVGNMNSLNLDSTTAGAIVDVSQVGNKNWSSVVQH